MTTPTQAARDAAAEIMELQERQELAGLIRIGARDNSNTVQVLARFEAQVTAAKDAEIAAVLADRDALWKALHDATSVIGHAVPMDTVVLAGRKLVVREVWQAAHDLLYPKAARAALTDNMEG